MYKVFRVASTDKYSRKRGIFPTKYRIQMINYFVYHSLATSDRRTICVCVYIYIYIYIYINKYMHLSRMT